MPILYYKLFAGQGFFKTLLSSSVFVVEIEIDYLMHETA
jgi:hypothetical protein